MIKNNKTSKESVIDKVIKLEKKLNRRPVKRDDSGLYFQARKLFGSWNKLMESAGYAIKPIQKISDFKVDEDFAYFLGLLITDGHICYDKEMENYKIAIYSSYEEEKNMLKKLIKKVFNYNAGVSSRMYGFNKVPNYEIRISSKRLCEKLIKEFSIPPGAKSSVVIVPKFISDNNGPIKESFLKGVIDGDGSISRSSIKIASGSIIFLKEIKELLESLSVSSTKILLDNKKSKTFSIRVNKKEDLIKIKAFYKLGFSYKRKKARIDNI